MTKNSNPSGVLLKEARQSQGLALESVHEATKIPMDVLRAIEEGYTVRTLSPFYLKGFIKMYAQYLNVTLAPMADSFRPEELPKPPKNPVKAEPAPVSFRQWFTPRRQQQLMVIVGGVVFLFVLSKLGGCLIKKGMAHRDTRRISTPVKKKEKVKKPDMVKKETPSKPSNPGKVKVTSREEQAVAVVPKVEVPAAADESKESIVAEEQEAPGKSINLTVRSKKKVWLQVRVDGNLVFQSNLREGTVETWQADEDIELSGKNINYLEFELNGKGLGSLGGSDRNARRVLVTKQGLTLKQ